MARPRSDDPTEVELQILRVLWSNGPSPVRTIHDELQDQKETNYATTVKMLSVMLEKGIVRRDESVRPQVYRAAVTQGVTQKRMLSRLIDRAYEGSAKNVVMQALSTKRASREDLADIRRMLDDLEGSADGEEVE